MCIASAIVCEIDWAQTGMSALHQVMVTQTSSLCGFLVLSFVKLGADRNVCVTLGYGDTNFQLVWFFSSVVCKIRRRQECLRYIRLW